MTNSHCFFLSVCLVAFLRLRSTSAFLPTNYPRLALAASENGGPSIHATFQPKTSNSAFCRAAATNNVDESSTERETLLDELTQLLESTPANAPTSRGFTNSILQKVRKLEENCPTAETDVISKLAGNWELLWTTQDTSSEQYNSLGPLLTWINPLENQSYSNNPNGAEGRLNPVLPRPVQDQLERIGLIKADDELSNIRSTQSIDLKRQRVRNVVTFGIPSPPGRNNNSPRRASLTVDIDISNDRVHKRRVNVKFQACRVVVPQSPIDFKIPLGFFGPTGWLETKYIDDNVRITRGHKGSVFVLKRPSVSSS